MTLDQDNETKQAISEYLNTQVTDQSFAQVIRRMIFDSANTINWSKARNLMVEFCPEIRFTDEPQDEGLRRAARLEQLGEPGAGAR